MTMERIIIHIDMDAFYASIEQRDHPALRGKPVVVGGPPYGRGVVATCSYEARKYGVRSAMSSTRAFALCPQATFVKPRFAAYKAVSREIMDIFTRVTPLVEPLSLDEAYLDVTENSLGSSSGPYIARYLLGEIKRRTGLSASAGVASSKFVAKIASGFQKPNGLTVVASKDVREFLAPLSIQDMHGVGKVSAKLLARHGFHHIRDLQTTDEATLRNLFSAERTKQLLELASGIDHRPVVPKRPRKSIGSETTFQQDSDDTEELRAYLQRESEHVIAELERRQLSFQTVSVKWKTAQFEARSRQMTLTHPCHHVEELHQYVDKLFADISFEEPVRLIGLSVSQLLPRTESMKQLSFDDLSPVEHEIPSKPLKNE